jgi:hypothetical protein
MHHSMRHLHLYLIGNERKLLVNGRRRGEPGSPIDADIPGGDFRSALKSRTLSLPERALAGRKHCRDVLAIDPSNQTARILLVLSLTDQFEHGVSAKEVLPIAAGLTNDYHRAYYSGIIHERQAIAEFRRHADWRARRQAHILFQNAMESYRRARAIRPPDNDDAVLRWNACVRFLEHNWGLQ